MSKRAILLINLGTPDSPEVFDVKKYLAEFLMDRFVISIPKLFRWCLVHFFILPTRPKKSAAAYQKIWNPKLGSPLKYHTENLVRKVQKHLTGTPVHYAMRYGTPSIFNVLQSIKNNGASELTILPLYPQYALSSTQTAIEEVHNSLRKINWAPQINIEPAFYNEDFFLSNLAESIMKGLKKLPAKTHLLLSYHGLPQSHLTMTECEKGVCQFNASCCSQITSANKNCYRAQCYFTTREIVKRLNLKPADYSTAFQSRLGPTPWIQPFTDEVLKTLALEHKHLAVACPSFVADCLETLEEIQIRAERDFKSYGGESLTLIPCLNDDDKWAKDLAQHLYKS